VKTRLNARPWSHALAALLPALWLVASPVVAGQPEPELDEVLVLGEQPGPAMWKVSRDGHTMWIMGTLAPVPAKMIWRSKQVEAVIQQSGEVLGNTSARASFDIGFFGSLRLIPSILRALDNPGEARLRDVLPAAVHARWSNMHRRFFGKEPDPKEKRRPLFVADQLYRQALEKAGLTEQNPVWPAVEKLAKRHKVRIRERQISMPLEDPKGMIADLAKIPRDSEVACLTATMDFIDREMPNIRLRARAWAVGDLPALRALPAALDRTSCLTALLDALRPRIEEQAKQVQSEIAADRTGIFSWMLLTYETSFTAMPIAELLRTDGAVARWRAAGYTVEEPH
jgi:uncharacterized protein YbaP (TraB family)